ncbi:MAG TPA: hypothetical protein DCZ10_08800, partial [Pelotomaculum sp.]|nr:hypothetical protein [Pelotomaculum sp.]
ASVLACATGMANCTMPKTMSRTIKRLGSRFPMKFFRAVCISKFPPLLFYFAASLQQSNTIRRAGNGAAAGQAGGEPLFFHSFHISFAAGPRPKPEPTPHC